MSGPDHLLIDRDEFVIACPECNVAGNVHVRKGDEPRTTLGTGDEPLVCLRCSTPLETAIVRPPKRTGRAKYGHLDAEDVGL